MPSPTTRPGDEPSQAGPVFKRSQAYWKGVASTAFGFKVEPVA